MTGLAIIKEGTMATRQTKAEKISQIPIETISKTSSKDRKILEGYVRTLRSSYKRRVQSFQRKGLISHAQIALEGTVPSKKQVQLTKMTRNQLILEFARYAKFFNDVTSSEKGIRSVNREQDIRIFGKDTRGRPRGTMTPQERQRYWSLYEEYQNQDPTATTRYGSESVQQQIAEAIFDSNITGTVSIIDLMNDVEQKLQKKYLEENLRSVPNVYSGRWNPFSK